MLSHQEFSDAYKVSYSRTVRFLLTQGAIPDVAEEVAQDAWVRGWERQSQLKSDSALVPWVNSIAMNILRGYIKRESRTPRLLDGGEGLVSAHPQMSPEDNCDLALVLGRCTSDVRQLLWAYWAEGFTSQEIASGLAIKPVSVRVKVIRIAKTFQQLLLGNDRSGRTTPRTRQKAAGAHAGAYD